MKYLKLFESIEPEYVEIGLNLFNQLKQHGDVVSTKDILEIENVLNGRKITIEGDRTFFKHRTLGNRSVFIRSLPDDWFIVAFPLSISREYYYKCDQISGVIKLIKDKSL